MASAAGSPYTARRHGAEEVKETSKRRRGRRPAVLGPAGRRRPWTPLRKPLTECRLALVASSVCLARGAEPAAGTATPALRVVPADVDTAALRGRRAAPDDRGEANLDRNLGQAIERLREAEAAGRFGALNARHLALRGATDGASAGDVREKGREAARLLLADGVDIALLVPV
jgi:D-proline reductase (dithiol) PrdB